MNEIILGDCIQEMQKLPSESFDIVLADPPYNIGKDFGNDSDKMNINEYLVWTDQWIEQCIRVLKTSGTFYIYGFSEILAHISVRFKLEHRWLIWIYTNKTVPRFNFWQRSHEAILSGWKDKDKRIFNTDSVRVPYTDAFKKNASGKVRKATKGRFSKGEIETIYSENPLGALPRDFLDISALSGGAGFSERWFFCNNCDNSFPNKKMNDHKDHNLIIHPTQKPYKLTSKLLSASSVPNGNVLIPFCGSGSEAAVCQDMSLNWTTYEINEDYVKLAKGFLKNRND